ncbi:MAG: aldehyde dehydrogenase family protein [Thermoanaerobaculia bacterium]
MRARASTSRLNVRKTYKLYIGGEFPRTESGRSYPVQNAKGALVANACLGSRKDVRNAVVAARKALAGWSGKTAYNRGQVLYRIAEVCESRASELENELRQMGASKGEATKEVERTIDRWVYYAGWCDKFAQILGCANPVAGPYYNFSVPEPTGVAGIVAPDAMPLLGFVSRVAPAIAGGNTVVAIPSEPRPLASITMSEILATSDVPGGVVNVITGKKDELIPWLASHMDVNAIDCTGVAPDLLAKVQELAAENVKRVVGGPEGVRAIDSDQGQSLYAISDFLEIKTVWHPTGI